MFSITGDVSDDHQSELQWRIRFLPAISGTVLSRRRQGTGGRSRSEAAAFGGVGLQIVRDWVVRFNTKGPEGLKTGKAPGKQSLLSDSQREALSQAIERGPTPISTALSASGFAIWRSGFGKNSVFRSVNRR
jgi:hypothetical protein